MGGKATVNIGTYSRRGKTRGDNLAADHDMGCKEKYTPSGIVDEHRGELFLRFGSSAKTNDFIVHSLHAWCEHQPSAAHATCSLLQIKPDNGPDSNGQRTQFPHRMLQFADMIGKPILLL